MKRFGVGIWILGMLLAAGCGKKGPPLAPLVPIPAAVEAIAAERVGGDVYISLTIPSQNVDQFAPANIARVEVYGYTGKTPPPRGRWVEFGTLVETVPIAPPPPPAGEESDPSKPAALVDAPPQGVRITIHDTLTPDELVQGKEPPPIRDPRSEVRDPQSAVPKPERGPRAPEPPLRRFYSALPFSVKGRPGPPGAVAEIPLVSAPDAPPTVDVMYREKALTVSWEPSGGLIGFLLERTLPDEPPPIFDDEETEEAITDAPSGPVLYNVYREIAPDPFAPPSPGIAPAWRAEPPVPMNTVPLAALNYIDGVEFGRLRCYTVRAVRGTGSDARVGAASPPSCLMPMDIFGPEPPTGLATVASGGVISLIWEPNTELDLRGYIVLRGEAGSDTLQPLTTAPVPDARYRDETVKPGMRYTYAVIAVDNRFPVPNISAESSRVEETAR